MEPFIFKGTATEQAWDFFKTEVELRAAKAKEVALKYNIPFIPLQEKFNEMLTLCPADYWMLDGIHPTTAGHEIIAREWIKTFKKLT